MKSQDNVRLKSYLRLHCYMTSVISLFFILKFNFQYHEVAYNPYFIVFGCLIPAALILFNKLDNASIAGFVGYAGSSLMLTTLIYSCGGFAAPGVFWLGLMPLAAGILMGRRGLTIGAVNLVLVLGFFYISDQMQMTPNIIAKLGIYEEEKRINILIFCVFIFLLTQRFFTNEFKSRKDLEEQHKNADNLLKILIHDVANPVNAIELRAGQIKNVASDLKLKNYAANIEKHSRNVTKILTGIRDYRAVVDGKRVLTMNTFILRNLVNESIDSMNTKAEVKSVNVILRESSALDLRIETDEIIFKTVIFGNVLSNAIKFTPEGGSIFVRIAQTSPQFIEIEIADAGIGIPPEILKSIFDVNVATSRVGTAGETGTGYGMPLAKSYIETLGGHIFISSNSVPTKLHPTGTKIKIRHPIGDVKASTGTESA